MEFWLDTIDHSVIDHAKELGLLYGVTTNPSILSRADEPVERVLDRLLNCFSGPIAVQVTQRSVSEMIEQAKDLYNFSSRIIVKIPVTEEGIHAIARLDHLEIPTMATAIFEPMQVLLAAKSGARYVVPYFSHLGENALEKCEIMQAILKKNHFTSKLLVASLRTSQQVEQCALQGFSAMTLKEGIFRECLKTPQQTFDHLERFEEDWKAAPVSKLLVSVQKAFY